MIQPSFLWFDFETFGVIPSTSWPSQFAAIRTDMDFNPISEPIMLYCQLPNDQLPDPISSLMTGLTPQLVNEKGVCEPVFIQTILKELMVPNTCAVGYNNIRFDDEVIRHSLYRNFYDPYVREYKNGNSRWDIIDLVRMTSALRPSNLQWPIDDEGFVTHKLELLTQANGLQHDQAHDALSDVYATIAMAKLIKEKQPRLFNFYFEHRFKNKIESFIDSNSEPFLHISGMFGKKKHNLAVVASLASHQTNKNQRIVCDLSVDPSLWIHLSVEQLRDNLFTRNDDPFRVPLKGLHINKCPAVAPLSVLGGSDKARLQIDLNACLKNREKLLSCAGLKEKIQDVFDSSDLPVSNDPDQMIYSGGFFSWKDKQLMETIHNTLPEKLQFLQLPFQDRRLKEMLFRYRARYYFETLTVEEKNQWSNHVKNRLWENEDPKIINMNQFNELMTQKELNSKDEDKNILSDLRAYQKKIRQFI